MNRLIVLLLSILCLVSSTALAQDEAPLSFCSFGPKVKVFGVSFVKGVDRKRDPCRGTAKVQAMEWECALPGNNPEKVAEFRKNLFSAAKEECRKHCENRSRGCTGRLEVPPRGGRETDIEEATAAGLRFGCRRDCPGQAFVYVSIYDANYRMGDAEVLASEAPNCRCTPAK